MPVERLAPDAIVAVTNLVGGVAAVQDDPDSPDAAWLTRQSANQNTSARVSFPTPSGELAGTQEFRVRVRKTAESTAPSCAVELWVGGSLHSTVVAATTVSSTGGVVLAGTWDATGLPPEDVQCRVVGTTGGGQTSKRATVEVAAIEWNASVANPVTWAVWDGAAEDPASCEGVWDGATVQPKQSVSIL